MKLGPWVIQHAKAPAGETGYSGAPAWNGSRTFGTETDYNSVWSTTTTRWTTVQKMLTDADVSAALDAVVLPLLAAGLTVEPGEDKPKAREVAAFLQNDLENMSLSLHDTRSAALFGALSDGVAVFEKVWEYGDDGNVHLRKLAERPPRSIASDGWLVDEHGGPKGIKQLDEMGQPIELEIERLLMFIHRRRQGGILGESILRRVYGSWLLKTELMKVGAAAVARHAMGVPTMRPRSRESGYLNRVDELLAGLSSHEHSFVRLDPDQEMGDFAVVGVSGTMADPVPQLEYHRRSIYLGLLCPFLPLGADGVGSMALSETQSGFFLMLLQALAELEQDTYNRYLIPQWVSYNWPDINEGALPRVQVGRIDRRDAQAWFTAVTQAVTAGAVDVGDELRAKAEEMLGLEVERAEPTAEDLAAGITSDQSFSGVQIEAAFGIVDRYKMGALTREQAGAALAAFLNLTPEVIDALLGGTDKPIDMPTPEADQTGGAKVGEDPEAVQSAKADKRPSLVAIEALGIDVRFGAMEKRLNEREARIVGKLRKLQDKQARRLIAIATKAIKAGDVSVLETTEVATDEEADALYEEMLAEYDDAADDYLHELESQGVKPVALAAPEPVDRGARRRLLRLFSVEIARGLGDRMRTAWGSVVARQMRPEVGLNVVNLSEIVTAAGDRLLADIAKQSVTVSLSSARWDAAAANAKFVKHEIYSTMMDQNVCYACAQYEGEVFAVGEGPEAPGDHCEGTADRCRCVRVPVVE